VKIAVITRRYPPLIGGAEKVLSYLAFALAEEGADVSVLTARPPGLNVPEIETHAPAKGSGRVAIIRLGTAPVWFLGTWLYMRNLRRWLSGHELDVGYVSMLKHDAYVAVGEGLRKGFLVVLRPEGAGATGDIAWQSWGRFGRRIAERCRRAEAYVSIAPAITEELKKAGYEPARIHALPNGVPAPEPPWQRRADWRSAPRALFAGRLAPEKGLDVLIDAWPAVRESFPSARLTIVGEGPERPALEGRIANLGLGVAIDLPGAVENPSDVLRGCDLFVLPSREEGMSIALLEAMAMGVPLVATSIPGNRRLVQDCKHGRLVPPDNHAALASAIVAQWSNFDRAFHMGRAARKRVQAEFSITAVARKHIALFQKLLDEKRG
jgi:glycosyltransferase involved in cell wall biosynthesis